MCLLQLIWLVSPALPVGAFSYSEGLENAVERAGVATESIAGDWLGDQLGLGLARGDRALIAQAIPAWRAGDLPRIRQLNDWVLQTRETSELRAQTEQMARSLVEWLLNHEHASMAHIEACALLLPTYPLAFALAASPTSAGVRDCLLAYPFGWAENMVQTALKSVPLGQSAGQRILARLSRAIPRTVEDARALSDDERPAFPPMLAIISSQHETQYSSFVALMTLYPIANRAKKLPPLRVGIGAPVGSGKTTLLEMLCKAMRGKYDLVAITNDIYTKEDQRILTISGALGAKRIMGVETGGCPHTAIREDVLIDLEAIDRMLVDFPDANIVFVESGGDNLAATFSPELSDLTICVIDVAAGEKIPRKGGHGITKSNLFVIHKTDLAPHVGADLAVMEADTIRMRTSARGLKPFVMTNLKTQAGLAEVVALIETRGMRQSA